MENETQSISNDAKKPQPPAPESPKAKVAETRLKEMSKRAKQKGNVNEPKTKSKSFSQSRLDLLRNWCNLVLLASRTWYSELQQRQSINSYQKKENLP